MTAWSNAFVERYHRTSQEECLALKKPHTLAEAREVTAAFQEHYNRQRPNQALSCGNQPPSTAFPTLPQLPALPSLVDPDRWLRSWDGLHLERKVNRQGQVTVDLKSYYVSTSLAGQHVTLQIDAFAQQFHVFRQEHHLKSLPIKGLLKQPMPFDRFLTYMLTQAHAEQRLRTWQERRQRTAASLSP